VEVLPRKRKKKKKKKKQHVWPLLPVWAWLRRAWLHPPAGPSTCISGNRGNHHLTPTGGGGASGWAGRNDLERCS